MSTAVFLIANLFFYHQLVDGVEEPESHFLITSSLDQDKKEPSKDDLYKFAGPNFTFSANFGFHLDNEDYKVQGEPIDDRLFLRQLEVGAGGSILNIKPCIEGVAIIVLEQQPDLSFEVEPEEAYLNLGHFLKIGRARPFLTPLNLLHLPDLTQITRSNSFVDFFGGDDGFFEAGLSTELVETSIDLSRAVGISKLSTHLGIMNSNNMPISPTGTSTLSYYNHFAFERSLGGGKDLTAGTSILYMNHPGGLKAVLNTADIGFVLNENKELGFGSYKFSAEFYYASIEKKIGTPKSPFGGFISAEHQWKKDTLVGLRYDYVQDLIIDKKETEIVSAYVLYRPNDFMKYRFEISYRQSEIPSEDGTISILLDLGIIFGQKSEKHHH